jgi:hypothetical protein
MASIDTSLLFVSVMSPPIKSYPPFKIERIFFALPLIFLAQTNILESVFSYVVDDFLLLSKLFNNNATCPTTPPDPGTKYCSFHLLPSLESSNP